MPDTKRIENGDRVKDKITKRTGIVTCITDWLYGCRRIQIHEEKAGKDGKYGEFVIDEPQAVLLKKQVITGRHYVLTDSRHGDRPDAARAPDPTR